MVFLISSISFVIFYAAIALMEGTFSVPKMSEFMRQTVFGIWLGVVVFSNMCYFLHDTAKNNPSTSNNDDTI